MGCVHCISWFVIYLFVALRLASLFSEAEILQIDAIHGSSNSDCITVPCKSLKYAVSKEANKSTFVLLSDLVLDSVVNFTYSRNIVITRKGKEYSTISCSDSCTKRTTAGGCGLLFENSESITLKYITVKNCAIERKYLFLDKKFIIIYSALIITEGKGNTALQNVNLSSNFGNGLAVINSGGNMWVTNSLFTSNIPESDASNSGGGMLILASICSPFSSSCVSNTTIPSATFVIKNSNFTSNAASSNQTMNFLLGGGLTIHLSWGTKNTKFFLKENTFTNNSASAGGGLFIACVNKCHNNTINISLNKFYNNNASSNGGGVKVFVTSNTSKWSTSNTPYGNNISFTDCSIHNNYADLGGGININTGNCFDQGHSNKITFSKCSWNNNTGQIAAAVNISPDLTFVALSRYLPQLIFSDCNFTNNEVLNKSKVLPNHTTFQKRAGAFLVSRTTVHISGVSVFANNTGSALYLIEASASFSEGSQINFTHNSGYNGGAIMIKGFSQLYYEDNINFVFENNTAAYLGGAIYVSFAWDTYLNMFPKTKTCFLVHNNTDNVPKNVSFHFKGNKDSYYHSIYLTSAHACKQKCSSSAIFIVNSCLGKFYFLDQSEDQYDVITEPSDFIVNQSVLSIIPGEKFMLPVFAYDDFNKSVDDYSVYRSILYSEKSDDFSNSIEIDPSYNLVEDRTIIIYGEPSATNHLLLTPITSRGRSILVSFTMQHCPPGYVLFTDTSTKCVCSANLNSSYQYYGIPYCDEENMQAFLTPGSWIGYGPDKDITEDNLYTADCPIGYCKYSFAVGKKEFLLPQQNTMNDTIICAENREKFLCGSCKNGTSVFFHSDTDNCQEDYLCSLGALFYLVSELLPCIVLFVAVIVLEINFTSGEAYSIVFLVQMIKVTQLWQDNYGNSRSTGSSIVLRIMMIIYGTLNLDFFKDDRLSFCLWSGAGTLDMTAIRYVTIVFAMGLVVCTVLLFNFCHCIRINKYLKFRFRKRSHQLLQGLSAFIVICYFQCIRITFIIINFQTPIGKGGRQIESVVFYDGTMSYFHGQHLIYAIPALIALLTVVIPPPLLLLSDPFLSWLEGYLQKKNVLQHRQPWTDFRMKFKPVFDAFQGCFKDNYRFFAGLFFLYRIVIYFAFMANNHDFFNFVFEIILIIIITLQGAAQPFQKHWHNIIAFLSIATLLGVNTLSILIFFVLTKLGTLENYQYLHWMQTALVCLPIVYAFYKITRRIWLKIQKCFFEHQESYTSSVHDCNNEDHTFFAETEGRKEMYSSF